MILSAMMSTVMLIVMRRLIPQIGLLLERPRNKFRCIRIQYIRLLQLNAIQLGSQQGPRDTEQALILITNLNKSFPNFTALANGAE